MNSAETIVRSVSIDEEAAARVHLDLGQRNISELDWIERELGNILTLNYGWSLPEKKRIPGEVPVYGSNGVVGTHDRALVGEVRPSYL